MGKRKNSFSEAIFMEGKKTTLLIKLLVLFLQKEPVLCVWSCLLICLFFNTFVGNSSHSLDYSHHQNPVRGQRHRLPAFMNIHMQMET